MNDPVKHLLSLKNPKEISESAHTLSLDDVKVLLTQLETKENDYKDHILPIVLGLQPSHFATFAASPLIQKRVASEPIQEKMHALVPHFQALYDQYNNEKQTITECINELPLFPVSADLLGTLCEQIACLSDKTLALNHQLDLVLKLTWLSDRPGLVDAFSALKNHFSNLIFEEQIQPTALLVRLNSIFGSKNEDSSMEGLSALGISYLEDIKSLGTHLDLNDLPEKNLLAAIHDRLNAAGLSTIEDLKKNKIYTKEHLFAYLKK
jgi:hypothetical protein